MHMYLLISTHCAWCDLQDCAGRWPSPCPSGTRPPTLAGWCSPPRCWWSSSPSGSAEEAPPRCSPASAFGTSLGLTQTVHVEYRFGLTTECYMAWVESSLNNSKREVHFVVWGFRQQRGLFLLSRPLSMLSQLNHLLFIREFQFSNLYFVQCEPRLVRRMLV